MKIIIIGLGAIGSSLAAAIKIVSIEDHDVFVYDKNSDYSATEIETSNYCGFSLIKEDNLLDTLFGSDLVIVATPLFAIKEVATLINQSNTKAVIIDVCSVKESVIRNFKDRLTQEQFKNYIPCHPLAGTEESGSKSCNPYLFSDKDVCICLHSEASIEAFHLVKSFWQNNLKCQVKIMTPQRHDIVLANTSHLMHLLSFHMSSEYNTFKRRDYFTDNLNIPSMQEVLRLGGSNKTLWEDIFKSNKQHLIDSITALQIFLDTAKDRLQDNKNIF